MWTPRELDAISASVRGAFRRYLPGSDTGLKNNYLTVMGKVLAVVAHEFELRMGWLTKQMFLSTATGAWLQLHCAEIGIYRKAASKAVGSIVGTGTPNRTYSAGMRFYAGGQTYVSTAPATATSLGALTVPVICETAGAAGNRDADSVLLLADPALWSGVGTSFNVDGDGLGGGADREGDDSLRARGLHRKRNPPKGGSLTDYERIAMAVPGVIRAWAFRDPMAPGFIVLLFLFDGRDDLIPLTADVEVVQAAIDAQRLIRVDDGVAAAPVARPVNVTITGLSSDTAEVRAAIESAVSAMFLARCRPGIPGDTFTISKSWIAEAISGATGEERHVLAAPSGDIVLTDGEFPVLGVMSYGA